jgi:isopentenyl-diphosphate delta-isomerase
MSDEFPLSSRKSEHLRISLDQDVRSALSNGLDEYRFIHQALPELDFQTLDLGQEIFGRWLRAPLLISSMTGGTPEAAQINRTLAQAAQQCGVALGLGSQRAGLEHPDLAYSFQVRKDAPDVLVLGNLGAVQLNYGYTVDHCRRAVEMIEADALYLHLNPLQEALQPEGDVNFTGLLSKIEQVCHALPVPVVVKEVGWGISEQAARQLASAGVAAIDVAGAGGTSWSQVEMFRIREEMRARVAAAFRGWGIPTAESIVMVRQAAPKMRVFASGGLRDGVDIARCIALGADLGGMAGRFLKTAVHSVEATVAAIEQIRLELQVCMFSAGAGNLQQLKHTPLVRSGGNRLE